MNNPISECFSTELAGRLIDESEPSLAGWRRAEPDVAATARVMYDVATYPGAARARGSRGRDRMQRPHRLEPCDAAWLQRLIDRSRPA